MLGCFLLFSDLLLAEIVGTPPFKVIEIPSSAYANHLDMVQDSNNVIYVAFAGGVKMFNGSQWQVVEVSQEKAIRKLYFDNKSRVYVGGWGLIGFIEMDTYGQYKFTEITPDQHKDQFKTIWDIIECNNQIYFRGLWDVFSYDALSQKVEHWKFKSKRGAISCINKQVKLQDRNIGLMNLEAGNWINSEIELENNALIYELSVNDDGSVFVLSESSEWRLISNNTVSYLDFGQQLPNLDNYVSIEALSPGKFVLGSSHGLLTFIDTSLLQTESFQLSNEWISTIIKSADGGLLVLTEFEIFHLQWPSPARIQGRNTGLSSDIYKTISWDNNLYALSSAGVFLEGKDQSLYQHDTFKRLNWTSKEAWDLLPLDDDLALLAESHRILMIHRGESENILPVSDVIYPRKFIRSEYNPNMIFVITEHDVQLLYKKESPFLDESIWQLKKIFSKRTISLVEQQQGVLLLGTVEHGLNTVTFDPIDGSKVQIDTVSEELGLAFEKSNNLSLLSTLDEQLYAYNSQGMYRLDKAVFVVDSIAGLAQHVEKDKLMDLLQAPNGKLYGHTPSKFIYQNEQNKWQSVDINRHARGSIHDVSLSDHEAKISLNGPLITYLTNIETKQQSNPRLLLTRVSFKGDDGEKLLPINPQNEFSFKQGSISFSYVLTDINNNDKVRYQFRLSGYEDSFSAFTDNNEISFNKLNVGTYSFEFQAIDHLNHVYPGKIYTFRVLPLWYLTVYAKIIWAILIVAVLFLLGWWLMKWREKIHEAQKVVLKKIINEKTRELKQLNDNLQKMAHQDGLTGLSNRLYLDEFIQRLTASDANSVIAIMLDMDYFKNYNDQNGHLAGDKLLKLLAKHLRQEISRSGDLIARYGGEEFVVILVDTTLDYACNKSETIRKLIENKQNKISISIGISEVLEKPGLKNSDNIYKLIDQADQALYHAKKTGRNRVSFSNP
ncbi:MAG: GGDEF domain-containing protein [Proteobacteria bacterium]|nr:GGDEF domain-containing protein [Pseudomonadota bacterium]